MLREMGHERGDMRGFAPYWRELTAAHHMLGNHAAELKAARRARDLYPTRPFVLVAEVVALAALGRVADVHRGIDERLASASTEWPDAEALMVAAARELRAHGHPEEARVLLQRSIESYRDRQPAAYRSGFAIALYESGHLDHAHEAFRTLLAENPEDVTVQGYLGAIAARNGDRAEAERTDDWLRSLERPYVWGAHTLWRARLAALLGERQRAVRTMARNAVLA